MFKFSDDPIQNAFDFYLCDPVLEKSQELRSAIYGDVDWLVSDDENILTVPENGKRYEWVQLNGKAVRLQREVIGLTKICGEVYCRQTWMHEEGEKDIIEYTVPFRYMVIDDMWQIRYMLREGTTKSPLDERKKKIYRYDVFQSLLTDDFQDIAYVDAFYSVMDTLAMSRKKEAAKGLEKCSKPIMLTALWSLEGAPTQEDRRRWPLAYEVWQKGMQDIDRKARLHVAACALIEEAERLNGRQQGVRFLLNHMPDIAVSRDTGTLSMEAAIDRMKDYIYTPSAVASDNFYGLMIAAMSIILEIGEMNKQKH